MILQPFQENSENNQLLSNVLRIKHPKIIKR